MAKLQRCLQEWTQASLISAEQAKEISAYEEARPTGNRLLFSFMALGASVVGIGLISLVAANWSHLSDFVKLGGDLLLLLSLAAGVWSQRARRHALAWELLLTFFSVACLASLGLISQIYHAQGSWDQAVLLWVLIILPVVTLGQREFLPFAWSAALLLAASYRLTVSPLIDFGPGERWLLVGYGLPMVCAWVATVLRRWPPARMFANAFRDWGLWTAVSMIVVVDFSSMIGGTLWHGHPTMAWTGVILGGPVLVSIMLRADLATRVKSMLSLMVLLYLFMVPTVVGLQLTHWFAAPFTMALFALAAIFLVWEKSLPMANGLIVLLGLRFLLLFFTAFGGLMATGIGLILSGLFILAVIWLWMQLRNPLLRWMEGLAQ